MQAATGIDSLKMGDSPAKKLIFESTGKENNPIDAPEVVEPVPVKLPQLDAVKEIKEEKPIATSMVPAVAPAIKSTEADEPLLQENPHRFVLFPIKYHEVRTIHIPSHVYSGVLSHQRLTCIHPRYGKCTRKPKPPSGQLRKSTSPKICTTGTTA